MELKDVSLYHFLCMHGISIRDHRVLVLSLRTMSYYSLLDCFVTNITHLSSSRLLKREHPSKKSRTLAPIFFNSLSFLMGVPLFQSNQPEGYFSPRQLTCPAGRSLTDKPSGFALSLVPADGTAVLMGHSVVCRGEVLQNVSNSNTICTVKCQREM